MGWSLTIKLSFMKKCFLGMSENVLSNLKVWVCLGGLVFILNQTKGALSLGVVLGLGMLR